MGPSEQFEALTTEQRASLAADLFAGILRTAKGDGWGSEVLGEIERLFREHGVTWPDGTGDDTSEDTEQVEYDTWTSASRQHYIDTGEYLPVTDDSPPQPAPAASLGPPSLDVYWRDKVLTLASFSQGEAASALVFADHYAKEIQNLHGEASSEFEEATRFRGIAFEMHTTVKTYVADLQQAKPDFHTTDG